MSHWTLEHIGCINVKPLINRHIRTCTFPVISLCDISAEYGAPQRSTVQLFNAKGSQAYVLTVGYFDNAIIVYKVYDAANMLEWWRELSIATASLADIEH